MSLAEERWTIGPIRIDTSRRRSRQAIRLRRFGRGAVMRVGRSCDNETLNCRAGRDEPENLPGHCLIAAKRLAAWGDEGDLM